MEEQTKAIEEKQLSLEYFFNGYIDYSRTDAAKAKNTTIYLLLLPLTTIWILLLIILGWTNFIAQYFITITGAGSLIGLYMVRNSIIDWICEFGSCLLGYLERYPNFPWISKRDSAGIAAFLGFCLVILFPFAVSTLIHEKTRMIMQLTCVITLIITGCFYAAYLAAKV